MIDILKELCSVAGVSGDESPAASAAQLMLSQYCDNVSSDALGNVTGVIEGEGTHILLDAHLDRIGLIVTDIDETGFLRFAKCGGADERLLCAAEVTVWGKRALYGVICSTPPHLAKPEDKGCVKDTDSLGIDIGLSYDEARELVTPGDRVTFNAAPCALGEHRFTAAALDNRAGVAVILRALELLKGREHGCKITVVFSVCEETVGSGAKTAAFAAEPEEAVCFDVSFGDSPQIAAAKCRPLGTGAMIGISPILSKAVSHTLKELAESGGISHTLEIMGGRTGTNSDNIACAGRGVKTALISIPLRNMHSAVEVVDLRDLEACARLTADYILARGGKCNA